MLVPGSNLLSLALTVINPQGMMWARFIHRELNDTGVFINEYAPLEPITGSAQGVDRKLYEKLGLDFERNYIVVYTSAKVSGVLRDESGDVIQYGGKSYKVQSSSDWDGQDGWSAFICVQVDKT